MKPLGYYVDSSAALDELQETFGAQLQAFTISQKLHLLAILAIQQQVIADGDQDSDDYRASDAYQEHPFTDEEGKVITACRLLKGCNDRALRGVMQAIAAQLNGG